LDIVSLAATENLSVDTALAIERALVRFFLGLGNKTDLLNNEERCSAATYYRWRKDHPDFMQALEDHARLRGLKEQRGETVAFESGQMRASRDIQRRAMDILHAQEILDALRDIALGKPIRVELEGDDVRWILVYPKSRIEAMKLIQEVARFGAQPETRKDALEFLDRIKAESRESRGATLEDVAFGTPTHFTRITAETADGRTVTAEVKRDIEVINGESGEVQNDPA
jgi:transcription elongation GreA/GreB family factor